MQTSHAFMNHQEGEGRLPSRRDMVHSYALKIHRKEGRPGFVGYMRRLEFGDLPEEVVLLIFSFLRVPSLRHLRLVCRAFRHAAMQYITGLRLADGNKSSVISAMRVFPKIESLTVQARVTASHENWPQSVSRLRSLTVYRSAIDGALQLPRLFPHLSGLTALAIRKDANGPPGLEVGLLTHVVACCPALRSLEIEASWAVRDREPDHYADILQLTALQELKLFGAPQVWSSLLSSLTCLTLLRSLTSAHVETSQDVRSLAALTQLISLGVVMKDLSQCRDCLPALKGLKRVAVSIPNGATALGPLLQLLPTSLEGLCVPSDYGQAPADFLHVVSGLTRLDRLEIGCTSWGGYGCGAWFLGQTNPWSQRLVGLRHLGLVGHPTGAPDVRLLAQNLTALEHLRLRLDYFDDVPHLSTLTRLTLLHLYSENPWKPMSQRAMGLPTFLSSLQLLRHLSLYWEIIVGKQREFVACLASLVELERLHVELVPMERAQASPGPPFDVGADASLGTASNSGQAQSSDATVVAASSSSNGRRNLGIQALQPLVRLVSLQEILVERGYKIDKKTWQRIQKLRGMLSLPLLSEGSVFAKIGDLHANMLP